MKISEEASKLDLKMPIFFMMEDGFAGELMS
jgi:hypothetical protein